MSDKTKKLEEFVAWVDGYIKGDEKGEAQIYLNYLFQVFGHKGLLEAGATCEERVKKNDTGGTSFADLVWKPRVVVEMKKRGANRKRHYRQAFEYWTYLVPNRPRYAVLCNFDEFWVYDFETQMDMPVEMVKLADLPNRYGALNFLFPGDVVPVFGNHHEEVTREAADKLAKCFNAMVRRGIERPGSALHPPNPHGLLCGGQQCVGGAQCGRVPGSRPRFAEPAAFASRPAASRTN